MFWGKFLSASDDVATTPRSYWPSGIDLCSKAMEEAQLFYLPTEGSFLDGKVLDDEIKQVLVLPFQTIAVLNLRRTSDGTPPWHTISIAVDGRGALYDRLGWTDSERPNWAIMSVLYHQARKKWVPFPAAASVNLNSNGPGYFVDVLDASDAVARNMMAKGEGGRKDVIEQLIGDCGAVQDLCVMLSLHNVSAVQQEPPDKLAAIRQSRGKKPFRSYTILSVDGELWNGEERGGTNDGYRSHVRRGHLRTLAPGRRIFVSSCYVKGRQSGFVDKVYDVNGPRL